MFAYPRSLARLLIGVAPDAWRLHYLYLRKHRRILNLRSPKTFSEKIQCSKLRSDDPHLSRLADKVAVKDYVRERCGEAWLIPTIFAGPQLPPLSERNRWSVPFVIKPTHASGCIVFVRSPVSDWSEIEAICGRWLSQTFGHYACEHYYRRIPPQIIVEPLIGGEEPPPDYKFFVFGGRVHYIQVDTDRAANHKRAFFDRNWQRQPCFMSIYPEDLGRIPQPSCLAEMIDGAELLAENLGFVRVDLYAIDGQPKFGEMTFMPESGLMRFSPQSWDFKLGALWP
jgi:hypothetical protein